MLFATLPALVVGFTGMHLSVGQVWAAVVLGMGMLLCSYGAFAWALNRHLEYGEQQMIGVLAIFAASSMVIILAFVAYYQVFKLLVGPHSQGAEFYFSTMVFTGVGLSEVLPTPGPGRMLAGFQALLGTTHIAMFVLVFLRNGNGRRPSPGARLNGSADRCDADLKNAPGNADTTALSPVWICRMDFLRNTGVAWRLRMGFGLLLVLVVAVVITGASGGVAQKRAMQQVSEVSAEKVRLLSDLLDANNEMLVVRREMLIRQGDAREADEARIAELVKRYEANWKAYLQLPADAAAKALADNVVAKRALARPLNKQAGELMAQGDYPAAVALTLGQVREAANGWNKALADAVAHEQKQRELEAAHAVALGERNVLILLVLGGVALLVGIVASFVIARSMTTPLARAVQLAERMAKGQLEQDFNLGGRDELTRLGQAMTSVRDNVQATIRAQLDMAGRHEAGEIRYRMPADEFPGDFGRMVAATNSVVEAHVDVQFHMVEVMQRYAIGDLTPDLREYPGEKAVLTRTMATVKTNLAAMSRQIDSLAEAAQAGDFSVRGDESAFSYQFKGMVARLNAMMAGAQRSIDDVSAVLTAIAAGDLGKRMDGEYHGVFARMRDDANRTSTQLTGIVRGIQDAAGSIDNAAQELAAGNADLSRRTEQQAANLEEAAASMEELTSTVRQNAELANQADREAHAAGDAVLATERAMAQMTTVMKEIDQSSSRIAEITSVIDGIAFQTNILALNAAVEAARAGDHGRGFAVVASEVRTLAQRAGSAAKEIKELIGDASSKVQTGLSVTVESEAAIARLAQASARTTQLMSDIAAATKEQAAGIEQVNQVVVQMDQVTQQNAALVEEATAASRALEEQAQALTSSVSVFRIDGSVRAPVTLA